METPESLSGWILIAIIAYGAFSLGRMTAGVGGGVSESQRLADEQEIAGAVADVPMSKWEEIDRLLQDRKKIAAIKILREATGLGLKLSKQAVEQRAAGR